MGAVHGALAAAAQHRLVRTRQQRRRTQTLVQGAGTIHRSCGTVGEAQAPIHRRSGVQDAGEHAEAGVQLHGGADGGRGGALGGRQHARLHSGAQLRGLHRHHLHGSRGRGGHSADAGRGSALGDGSGGTEAGVQRVGSVCDGREGLLRLSHGGADAGGECLARVVLHVGDQLQEAVPGGGGAGAGRGEELRGVLGDVLGALRLGHRRHDALHGRRRVVQHAERQATDATRCGHAVRGLALSAGRRGAGGVGVVSVCQG